jgi:hypothetical protein
VPEAGQLVRARGQQWVVAGVSQSRQPVDELAASRLPGRTLVQLTSVSDDDLAPDTNADASPDLNSSPHPPIRTRIRKGYYDD